MYLLYVWWFCHNWGYDLRKYKKAKSGDGKSGESMEELAIDQLQYVTGNLQKSAKYSTVNGFRWLIVNKEYQKYRWGGTPGGRNRNPAQH